MSDQNNASPYITFDQLAALESSPYAMYKHMYVDICDDLVTGILLSKIVYWFGIGRNGEQRARHVHDGRVCIVKKKEDWWTECRISEGQYDRAIAKLIKMGVVSTEIHYNPFARKVQQRSTFIFINKDHLSFLVNEYLESFQKQVFSNLTSPVSETPEMGVSVTGETLVCEQVISGVCIQTQNTSLNTSQCEGRTPEISNSKKEKKPSKSPKPEKIPFRENVLLTQDEHKNLLTEVGSEQFDWMLDKLSAQKSSTGKQYKCDAATMWNGGWVREAWQERINKPQAKTGSKTVVLGNEDIAKNVEKEWIAPSHAKLEVSYKGIAIIPMYGNIQPAYLDFSEPSFGNQIICMLRKFGFIPRKNIRP